jgi:hypothetical protein
VTQTVPGKSQASIAVVTQTVPGFSQALTDVVNQIVSNELAVQLPLDFFSPVQFKEIFS